MKTIVSFLIMLSLLSTVVLAGSWWSFSSPAREIKIEPAHNLNLPTKGIHRFIHFLPPLPPPLLPPPEDIPPDIFCPEPYEPHSCSGNKLMCVREDVDGKEVFIDIRCENGCISTINFAQCM